MNKKCALIFFVWIMMLVMSAQLAPQEIPKEVILVLREKEILAFSALSARWVSQDIMAREIIQQYRTASHVAIVVTNLRVLGFSAETSLWDRERFEPDEKVVSIEADGKVASIVTNKRALAFGAPQGTWVVTRFHLK